jgi:hypothetical protein
MRILEGVSSGLRLSALAGTAFLVAWHALPATGASSGPPTASIRVEEGSVRVVEGDAGVTRVRIGFFARAAETYSVTPEQRVLSNFAAGCPGDCSGDFIAQPDPPITITVPAGATNPFRADAAIVCGDTDFEADERFVAYVRCVTCRETAGTVQVTIVNDDKLQNPLPKPNTPQSPIPSLEAEHRAP